MRVQGGVQGVQGQGCPKHDSTQPGPLTLLPHKTRVRHKKWHRSRTVSKRSLRGVKAGSRRMRVQEGSGVAGEGCAQHVSTRCEEKEFGCSPEILGASSKNAKKTRKTVPCMARLLRSYIQDFVQEIPVGQMAQSTPLRCPPLPP